MDKLGILRIEVAGKEYQCMPDSAKFLPGGLSAKDETSNIGVPLFSRKPYNSRIMLDVPFVQGENIFEKLAVKDAIVTVHCDTGQSFQVYSAGAVNQENAVIDSSSGTYSYEIAASRPTQLR